MKKRLLDKPEVREALAAWTAYDRSMHERYFTANEREMLARHRPKNPLMQWVFMDGYLQGKRAAETECSPRGS